MPVKKSAKLIDMVNWVDENVMSNIPAECPDTPREGKKITGTCRPVEAEKEFYWLAVCKLHKTASLSLADSDFTLVAARRVAAARRCLPNFRLTPSRGVRV